MIPAVIFAGLCGVILLCDWKHRAIPRMLPIVGAVAASVSVPLPMLLLGTVVGLLIALVADLPSGDLAVGGMLGAWLGVEAVLATWIVALCLGGMIWLLWEDRMIDWPGEWPFTPLLVVPACAIVLVRGA